MSVAEINEAIHTLSLLQSKGILSDTDNSFLLAFTGLALSVFVLAVLEKVSGVFTNLMKLIIFPLLGLCAWGGVSLFSHVDVTEKELTAINTIKDLKGEQQVTSDEYINLVMVGNAVLDAKAFMKDVDKLKLQLDALGVSYNDALVYNIAKAQ